MSTHCTKKVTWKNKVLRVQTSRQKKPLFDFSSLDSSNFKRAKLSR